MLRRLKNIFSSVSGDDQIAGKRSGQHLSKHFLYREESPFNKWKLTEILGDGAFGKVHQAVNNETQEFAAVKIIEDFTKDELVEHLVEVEILKDCQQKNIIRFYEAYLFEKKFYIFLEYCTYGAVDHIMNTIYHSLNEKQIIFIAHELLNALNYLHTQRFVIHRDVKASNVLLTENGQVKLADFGISVKNTHMEQKQNEYTGTVYWMAPEVFFCEGNNEMQYDYRVDIWSFGITLIELAERDPPHHDLRPERVGAKIRQAAAPTLREPQKWNKHFSDLLSCCLKRNPIERSDCRILLEHPFLENALSFHSSILYLLEEFKALPVIETIEEKSKITQSKSNIEPTIKESSIENQQPTIENLNSSVSSFSDDEETNNVLTKLNQLELGVKPDERSKNYHELSSNLLKQIQPKSRLDTTKFDEKSETENEAPQTVNSLKIKTSPVVINKVNSESETFLKQSSILKPTITNETFGQRNSNDLNSKVVIEPLILSSLLTDTDQPESFPIEHKSITENDQLNSSSTNLMGLHIEINRLRMEDITERSSNNLYESIYEEILEEILQSDYQQPSIPDVILSVIIDLTEHHRLNDLEQNQSIDDGSKSSSSKHQLDDYYLNVKETTINHSRSGSIRLNNNSLSKDSFKLESNSSKNHSQNLSSIDHQAVRITRRFITPDGNQEEIVTEKIVEPFRLDRFRSTERKQAERKFRRLYHLEKSIHEQMMNEQELEIVEQQREFNRKREQIEENYDSEIELLDSNYQMSMKKQYIRLRNQSNRNQRPLLAHSLFNGSQPMIDPTNLKMNSFRSNSRYNESNNSMKSNEKAHHQRMNSIEENYQRKKEKLIADKQKALWQLELEELQSRYDLLRKKTKAYYSNFYNMLKEESIKESKQFEEKVHEERASLIEYFFDAQINWSRSWKKIQQIRGNKIQRQGQTEGISINDRNRTIEQSIINDADQFAPEKNRLHIKYHQMLEELTKRQEIARNELLNDQRKKFEKCTAAETSKLSELQKMFEKDWLDLRQKQKSRKMIPSLISVPFSSGKLLQAEFSNISSTADTSMSPYLDPILPTHAPVLLRSSDFDRSVSWYSWPAININEDQKFYTLSIDNDSILF